MNLVPILNHFTGLRMGNNFGNSSTQTANKREQENCKLIPLTYRVHQLFKPHYNIK